MYQRGGDHAATARQKTEQTLIAAQGQDGSWYPRNGNGRAPEPCMPLHYSLSLSVHHHFLPIYQK